MKVTLSFDNGPSAATSGVLDVLADHGVAASFFVVGYELARPGARALSERALAEGHWIGNHTLTHSIQFGDSDDPDLPAREIGRTQDLLGPLSHSDKLFRPYGGGGILDRRLLRPDAVDYLRRHAYTCVLWNCVPHDWDRPDDWVERCLADIATRPWSLVVLHDLPTGAMRHLPRFLERLDALGADIAQEFPDHCVPLHRGRYRGGLDHLVAAPGVDGTS
ncbi:polysaccharide deacetylase family protein [Nocardia terpenica]|uniref:polysaccharide deacetylase family protein n=1 Tax=Nocardia terpenica TaxID=455432 RepID=UPI001893E0C3|nr:polysaccharide deacetylase family protein [Nocardia terpenica]MBF6065359.1 polysaccharide deacetylase family protein [Nocardia terpenica]MBF6108931.1 polysaccharide deacetylase family protein [Nocardia terpenica]MBF6121774.1 polysaccharide deacetylase family protein [Nocardia terpenica]